jgi:hypothetical protein
MLGLLLRIAALILFLISAFAGERWPRVNLVALGLACWVASTLVGGELD